ncbi:MAG TPA: aromatic amino acid lyase, partial [Saprospiraceae bacterium]|nr:aromatic amino acid lyase [Saprospiraceae bacterium]
GFNFGLQGAQFTATSTTAENQTLSFPMYVHSISCNKDNQDIVSMGSNSALIARKVVENAFEVISIHLMTIVTAVEYLQIEEKLAPATKQFYLNIREFLPPVVEDKPLSDIITNATRKLKDFAF